ncbi:MAG TPA: penicillin-binding transpeptidase domain-containing protein [Acidimicrobiales bacterium]|jgi:peptidoglycan glycosyltransferase
MGRRIRWAGVTILVCFALLIVQLVNVQFRRAPALADSPYNPRVAAQRFDNVRGSITASDGTILAESVKTTQGPYHYTRAYPVGNVPGGNIYAGVTGYDSIFFGTSGIEYEYNSYLEAHPQQARNLSQLIFDQPASAPDNVVLTIDPVLQQAAWNALTTLPPGQNRDGAVVVLNPTTGAILAMVSNPTFDTNAFASPNITAEQGADYADSIRDHEGYQPDNPIAIGSVFAPGSTFKVVTSTAVYNLDPSLENFSFKVAPFVKFPNGLPIYNDGGTPCGGTMITMLPASCDPGYAALGAALGIKTLTQQAQLFGLNVCGPSDTNVPGIDLPHVQPSCISDVPPGPVNDALVGQTAIGQYDDAMTPLQNALVASAIADGGVIMTPHLMAEITDPQGNVITTFEPTPMLRASSQTAAAAVDDLMEGVATHGTAAGVGFPSSWQISVKTGTAQFPGGKEEETQDWMIGFMPSRGTPQLAFAVVVPQQEQDLTGALVAGPIVKAVVSAYVAEKGLP